MRIPTVKGATVKTASYYDCEKIKIKIIRSQIKNWSCTKEFLCKLWCDGVESAKHIISEWSKLWQKEYKTKYDLMGKGNPWELCKIFKFENSDQLDIHKLESIREV